MKNHFYALLCSFCIVCFQACGQVLSSSNLPIVTIDTKGNLIADEPKIMADFKIIYNGVGKRNLLTDKPHYAGKIGIETRGSTSQQLFPKKPYGFETWNAKGEGIDASFFGWPAEQDWILFASYNEKSLMNNLMAMKMFRDMGLYASRTQHVEVMLNGQYQGVYVMMEKVKRSEGRVAVSKLSADENTGDALTGGYIFKVDKTTGSGGNVFWTSKIAPSTNTKGQKTNYIIDYPNPKLLTFQQKSYIQTYCDSAEAVLNSNNFLDKTNGYRKYYDTQTFAKFFIINEVSRNVDGYRISTYFHKDKHSKDRRIKAGPAWDFDLGFGNADYCEGWQVFGWSYLFGSACPDDYYQVPFHWRKMLQDPQFQAEVGNEYFRLRKTIWSTTKLNAYIDSVANSIDEGQARNFQRWPVLGQYLWPNPRPVPTSWRGEITELKTWLTNRLNWLDANMPAPNNTGLVLSVNDDLDKNIEGLKVNVLGNPIDEQAVLQVDSERVMEIEVQIVDINGRSDTRHPIVLLQKGRNTVALPVVGPSGIYVARINSAIGIVKKKILKK